MTDSSYDGFVEHDQLMAKLVLDFIDSGFPGELQILRTHTGQLIDIRVVRYQDCRELTTEIQEGGPAEFSAEYWAERLKLNDLEGVKPDKKTGVRIEQFLNTIDDQEE
jgi:hypothetical protein